MNAAHDDLASKVVDLMETHGVMIPGENEPEEYGDLLLELLVGFE